MGGIISWIKAFRKRQIIQTNQCAICSSELNLYIKLECGHCFCGGCLKEWKNSSQKCPLCCQIIHELSIEDIGSSVVHYFETCNLPSDFMDLLNNTTSNWKTVNYPAFYPFFYSFYSLKSSQITEIIEFIREKFVPEDSYIWKVMFLCSFDSLEDLKQIYTNKEHIISTPEIFDFLFPKITTKDAIPDIRRDYLPLLYKSDFQKYRYIISLVKLWNKNAYSDLTQLCEILSNMTIEQFEYFKNEVMKIDFTCWEDQYHIQRIMKESKDPITLMKVLLCDFFPQQQWTNDYQSRIKLFSMFDSFTTNQMENYVTNVDCVRHLKNESVQVLQDLAEKSKEQ